jgi:hypothetical protein
MKDMQTLEEERLREPEPVAEGRAAPTRDEKLHEEEQREKDTNREIEQAQSDVNTAAMFDPNNLEIKRLQGELLGANAKTINPDRLRQVANQAKDEAAKEMLKATAGGLATLVGIGAAMAGFGVVTDGKHYPVDLLGSNALLGENAALPTRERQGQEIFINQ